MNYNYNYTYDSPTTGLGTDTTTVAFLGAFFLAALVLIIASYAIGSFLLGRLFKKAGVPQWIAWVPIYNTWKLLEIGNQQGFWALFGLIPLFNALLSAVFQHNDPIGIGALSVLNLVTLVFVYISMYQIGKKLGKEDWFVIIAIFIPIVWLIWLGFDDSKWPIDKKTVTPKATRKTKKVTT